MKRLLITLVLAGALGTTAAALAAGHHPISEKVLGAASVAQHYSFHVHKPADVVVAKATVPPGASFGWHSHRAAVAAVVQSGTLSLYDSADPQLHAAALGGRTRLRRAAEATSISRATRARSPVVVSSPTSASSTASAPTCRPRLRAIARF